MRNFRPLSQNDLLTLLMWLGMASLGIGILLKWDDHPYLAGMFVLYGFGAISLGALLLPKN